MPPDLTGVQNHLCAAPLVLKKQYKSLSEQKKHQFSQGFRPSFHHLSLRLLSLSMLCTKIRNHSFYNRKLHTFWCSAALFGTSKRIKTEVRPRVHWNATPFWDLKSPRSMLFIGAISASIVMVQCFISPSEIQVAIP